ncbi:SDR family NAD(P)-dependent oxidoreductase [Frondihabitans australicus]|uniref:Short-subunit dehydrogenase n=1 Tax=Frondihabitans australicus TaxID=386892 RepID=A0A495III0_9MICO|nr:SDR family NAD(P)-dependent oxidoreductase [Frondihabitans australicus]RKR75797.1 short-subunit dehydrogenase [Frondihabitans australicus]
MTSLTHATVLVTGASGGLGKALVRAALDRGADRVYAASRTNTEWHDDRVVSLHVDLADAESVELLAAQTRDATVLVNNAAVFPRGDLLTADWDVVENTLETNLTGPLRLTRALAPSLRAAHGALVNINSVLSWLAVGKAHSVSKAGAWMATNALRLEFAPDGVQVLGVYPGPIDTPMQPGDDRSGMADPADVAAAIYDAVEAGDDELVYGPTAEKVHGALAAPVTALYPALASR